MNSFARLTLFSVAFLLSSNAQGFENLDFEQAMPDLSGDRRFHFSQLTSDVLPGWSVFDLGGFSGPAKQPVAGVFYNSFHLGVVPAVFTVFDGSENGSGFSPFAPIEGNYSLQIDARGAGGELTQAGTVPASARSIRFFGSFLELFPEDISDGTTEEIPASEIDLTLGGIELDVLELDRVELDVDEFNPFDAQIEYGANIPATLLATKAELRFVVLSGGEFSGRSLILDDIHFSSIPVPEPTTLLLVSFGYLFLNSSRQMRRKTYCLI